MEKGGEQGRIGSEGEGKQEEEETETRLQASCIRRHMYRRPGKQQAVTVSEYSCLSVTDHCFDVRGPCSVVTHFCPSCDQSIVTAFCGSCDRSIVTAFSPSYDRSMMGWLPFHECPSALATTKFGCGHITAFIRSMVRSHIPLISTTHQPLRRHWKKEQYKPPLCFTSCVIRFVCN